MTHLLQHLFATRHIHNGTLALAAFAMLAATALAPRTAQAQVVIDNFNDGDVSDIITFAGGADMIGIGVGPGTGQDGSEDTGLSIGINPGAGGGFAGFVVPGGDGTTDITGTEYLTFFLDPGSIAAGNQPLKLEINLQEDVNGDGMFENGGTTEDEFRAEYLVTPGTGYHLVQIPLASFTDENANTAGADDGFDYANLLQVVFAYGGLQGPEFTFLIDELIFTNESLVEVVEVVGIDNFDDGDVSDIITFAGGADMIGIGVGPGTGQDGSEDTGLSIGINPGAGGGFAGFVVPGGDGTTDITGTEYLTFFLDPGSIAAGNQPLKLEINLQEDVNGDGMFENGGTTEDEFRAEYLVTPGTGYHLVQIPLASFTDENANTAGADDGFDYANLLQVVFAYGGLQGPEFTFLIDELGFSDPVVVANETGTTSGTASLSSAYPNPFASQAQFSLTLERTETVRIEVFDVLGRRMTLLHEGPLAAQTVHTFDLNGSEWSNGMYLYRVTGETFSETRRVVLTK